MDTEAQAMDYAFASDLTLPVARNIVRLINEGLELSDDQSHIIEYIAKHVRDACAQGEQWAADYAIAQVRNMISWCLQHETDPVATVARTMRVDRTTAEHWIRKYSPAESGDDSTR